MAKPAGMRVVVRRFGDSQEHAIAECLAEEPQPFPDASSLQDGDIVVRVHAADIVWTDTVMASGQYQHRPRLPYAPGMCYTGVIAHVTPLATAQRGLKVGDRVAVASPETGPRGANARYQQYGGCATYAVAPASAARFVPASWSMAQAACFAYGYDTAYHALVECGKLSRGETVLVLGATGGVGIPALAIARLHGARKIIAVTRSEAKAAQLRERGATHVVVMRSSGTPAEIAKAFIAEVRAAAGPAGVNIVYDGVGGALSIAAMRTLRFGGRHLIVGWAATPNVGKAGSGPRAKGQGTARANQLPTNLIMMKGLSVIGCPAMIATRFDPSLVPRRVAALEKWMKEGVLPPPPVAAEFPFSLAGVQAALRSRIASGSVAGSTVVVHSDAQPKAKL